MSEIMLTVYTLGFLTGFIFSCIYHVADEDDL